MNKNQNLGDISDIDSAGKWRSAVLAAWTRYFHIFCCLYVRTVSHKYETHIGSFTVKKRKLNFLLQKTELLVQKVIKYQPPLWRKNTERESCKGKLSNAIRS